MKLSLTTIVIGLAALVSASIVDTEGIRNTPRDTVALDRRAGANANRPVASGNCCIANTSLKQDVCNSANGAQGRCVPGGSGANCNGALDCVAQANLACDASIIERGKPLCRAKVGNGKLQDGAKQITSLSQAKLN